MSKITFTPISYTGWNSLSYLLEEVTRLQAKKNISCNRSYFNRNWLNYESYSAISGSKL